MAIGDEADERPTDEERQHLEEEAATEVELAPVAVPKEMDLVRMEQISAGPVDFVARCTQGLFFRAIHIH